MGKKKLSEKEKAQALTKVEHGVPVTEIAADLKVSRQVVYKLMKAKRGLPKNTVPEQKTGSGRKRKTSGRTDRLLKQEVLASSSITAANLKKRHPELHVERAFMRDEIEKKRSLIKMQESLSHAAVTCSNNSFLL